MPLSRPLASRARRASRLKPACLILLALVAAGSIYEELARRRDDARLPQVGRSVDIGGRTLNIHCAGQGSPAVILDAGASTPGYAWTHIQAVIARHTRACWYDRAGEGWSDPGPFPRTSDSIVRDLHALLGRARVQPPYVLVGHSFGALNARVYHDRYSGEVAGLVLVDSAHEDEPVRAPAAYLGPRLPRPLWYPMHLVVQAAARIGLIRLLTPAAPLADDPSRRTREEIVEALRQRAPLSRFGDATVAESYAQARAARSFGNRPLIVLTRGREPVPSGDPDVDRQVQAYERVWKYEMQAQLARLSTRGRLVVVDKSGHGIPDEAPDAVVNAVVDVLEQVRQTRSAPAPAARGTSARTSHRRSSASRASRAR